MDYEALADSMNKTRRSKNEPEIPREEMVALLKQSASDISLGKLDQEESNALAEFRKLEIKRRDDELEQSIRDTPLSIKIVFWGLFWGIIYGFYYYFSH
jgi:hypothetical protein